MLAGGMPLPPIPHAFLPGSISSNFLMSPDLWFPGREVPALPSSKSWDAAEYSGVPSAGTVSPCCLREEQSPCDKRCSGGK